MRNIETASLLLCNSEFPIDDPLQIFRHLQRHSKKSRFPVLARFLAECTVGLKAELRLLPRLHRQQAPNFQSIINLASSILGDTECKYELLRVPLESALLCASQIGLVLGYFEADNLEFDLSTAVLGLQDGLFAAVAISLSHNISELASIGLDAVRTAFRYQFHVDQISRIVDSNAAKEKSKNCCYILTGVPEVVIKEEIEKFNIQKKCSALTKIRISHTDKNSVFINGPPSRVKDLKSSQVLLNLKCSPLPSQNGLFHSLELYNQENIKDIVESLDLKKWSTRAVHLPLLSPSSGVPFSASNAAQLLELVCEEILIRPHDKVNIMKGIAGLLTSSNITDVKLLSYGNFFVDDHILSEIDLNLPTCTITRHDLFSWALEDFNDTRISTNYSKLAIVGMSCRMPGGANNPDLLFQLLTDGRDVHTKIPADRFDVKTHFDPTGITENASETQFGNFIDNPGFFDASFFNMSPREAEQTDPMHRLALVTAYEALEMSGFSPNRTSSTNLKRVGTFYGVASDDYREVNAGQNISTYGTPGGERAFANGRINYFFKFGGPSLNIDTACSSSGAAINIACSSLWAGEVDLAIAGGLNVITNPDNYCMLSKGHFLSKTGQCKVWSKEADGYCRADGIGCVVIKRLEDAIAENDKILATILSAATNHSAEAISITHPHVEAQIDNYNQVMQNAGVDPLDVSYVELHGTGTQAGDGVESSSIVDVFAPLFPARKEDNPLYLGAIKSNIGHGEAAAGVASIIKVILAYQNNQIPRNIGIGNEMNPIVATNISNRNAQMVTENTAWPRMEGKKRYAVANSFGAHGGNTTFLLEEAPVKLKEKIDPRTIHVVALSAKSPDSLQGNVESLIRYLDKYPNTALGDLSYTLCARRIHHHTRITTTATTIPQLRRFLMSSVSDLKNLQPVPSKQPPVAFSFTGQGVFYEGISSQLFQDFPYFRKEITLLDKVSHRMGFPSIIPIITKDIKPRDTSPLTTHLAILIIEIALVRFWEQMGIEPNVVIGHSLGEYAALVTAGVISAADAILLVGKRAEMILTKCKIGTHHMLSVRASVETISKLASGLFYEISCLNSTTDTVLSGSQDEIQAIEMLMKRNGLKYVRLEIPFAFHSSQLDPILDDFEDLARTVTFNQPNIPVISPLLGRYVHDENTFNASYLRCASRNPVNFLGSLTNAGQMGIIDQNNIWIEIGPHPVCHAFIQNQISVRKSFASLRRNEDNFTTISKTLAGLHCEGVKIFWNEYFEPYQESYDLLHLYPYSWDEKNYWIPYRGTWALDKAHQKEREKKIRRKPPSLVSNKVPLISSSVHRILSDEFQNSKRQIVISSDIMRKDLWSAVNSHRVRKTGVATSSIWIDMAYTMGDYLSKGFLPDSQNLSMNLTDFNVYHSTLARKDTSKPQLLEADACLDLETRSTMIKWYKISLEGVRLSEAYASATICYENSMIWKKEWRVIEPFLIDRIDNLSRKALNGSANRISKNMVYSLFKSLVEYEAHYQGIQSVVLDGYEAYSEVTLGSDKHGDWFITPYYVECLLAVAGFVMNCSDVFDHQENFFLTPGWEDLRFSQCLAAGDKFRCYVRMVPTKNHREFFGDVVILRSGDDKIVGMCRQIQFRKVPWILMDKFFGRPEIAQTNLPAEINSTPSSLKKEILVPTRIPKEIPQTLTPSDTDVSDSETFDETSSRKKIEHFSYTPPLSPSRSRLSSNTPFEVVAREITFSMNRDQIKEVEKSEERQEKNGVNDVDSHNDIVDNFDNNEENINKNTVGMKKKKKKKESQLLAHMMNIVSRETGLDLDKFTNEITFTELGVDSLMSLVILQRFRVELNTELPRSVFLDFPTMKDFKEYLRDNY